MKSQFEKKSLKKIFSIVIIFCNNGHYQSSMAQVMIQVK